MLLSEARNAVDSLVALDLKRLPHKFEVFLSGEENLIYLQSMQDLDLKILMLWLHEAQNEDWYFTVLKRFDYVKAKYGRPELRVVGTPPKSHPMAFAGGV